MEKTLDSKLARIRKGRYSASDFLIADAKDGDMAFGVTAPGPTADCRQSDDTHASPPPRWKTRHDHLEAMRTMTASGLVDVMLMSASSAELLCQAGCFTRSAVTPAVRLNDTTDIWCARGACYRQFPSRPFATADIEQARLSCDLGLYSMTFSNDLECDLASLNAYRDFRERLQGTGLRHFLEVFNPAFDIGVSPAELGHYINDMIVKTLAGVPQRDFPLFLKLQFNGSTAMEELCRYDPERLIVGILGGPAGTTRDTFELAVQAEHAGGRVALFGRKINLAEHPLTVVSLIRACLEGRSTPVEAVREYHAALGDAGIKPLRPLEHDLQVTDPVLHSST